jgi:hypothetical protein
VRARARGPRKQTHRHCAVTCASYCHAFNRVNTHQSAHSSGAMPIVIVDSISRAADAAAELFTHYTLSDQIRVSRSLATTPLRQAPKHARWHSPKSEIALVSRDLQEQQGQWSLHAHQQTAHNLNLTTLTRDERMNIPGVGGGTGESCACVLVHEHPRTNSQPYAEFGVYDLPRRLRLQCLERFRTANRAIGLAQAQCWKQTLTQRRPATTPTGSSTRTRRRCTNSPTGRHRAKIDCALSEM